MKKHLLIISLVVLLFVVPFFVFSQTEVTYPTIPGVESPQEFLADADKEDIFPLFMAYLFHLLVIISVMVAIAVVSYGGFLHLSSAGDPEKKKEAKKWILSAMQGVLIVLFSYSVLYAVDSRFVLFETRETDDVEEIDMHDLEWEIKNVYYQIPFGLLIEDAILNEKAEEKLYAVLEATEDAEETAEDIYVGSKELLEIIEECPEGEPCMGEEEMDVVEREPSEETELWSEDSEWWEDIHEGGEPWAHDPFDSEIDHSKALSDEWDEEDEYNIVDSGGFGEFVFPRLADIETAPTGENDVPFFLQWDDEWKDNSYGQDKYSESNQTVGGSGCLPTSAAMVANHYGHEMSPAETARFAEEECHVTEASGTYQNLFGDLAEEVGLNHNHITGVDEMISELEEGRPVIAVGRYPPYNIGDHGGHAIVLTGIEGDTVYVNDSYYGIREISVSDLRKNENRRIADGKGPNNAHVIYNDVPTPEPEIEPVDIPTWEDLFFDFIFDTEILARGDNSSELNLYSASLFNPFIGEIGAKNSALQNTFLASLFGKDVYAKGSDVLGLNLYSASLFNPFVGEVFGSESSTGYVPTGNYFWDVGWCNHPHQYAPPSNCVLWGAAVPLMECCREMREATDDDTTVHREVPDEYKRFREGFCPDGWVRAGTFDCTGMENYILPGSVCCQKTEEVEVEEDPDPEDDPEEDDEWESGEATEFCPDGGSTVWTRGTTDEPTPSEYNECEAEGEGCYLNWEKTDPMTAYDAPYYHYCCCPDVEEVSPCPEGEDMFETEEEIPEERRDDCYYHEDFDVWCCPEEEDVKCPDGMVEMSEEICPEEAVSEFDCETIEDETGERAICCCPEEMIEETDCEMVFGEGWVDVDAEEGQCVDGLQDYVQCEFWEKEAGDAHVQLCCCTDEEDIDDMFCPEAEEQPEYFYIAPDECEVGDEEIAAHPETGEKCCEFCAEEECYREEGVECREGYDAISEYGDLLCCCPTCPPCPNIAPAVQAKIQEIEGYMAELPPKLDTLEATKDPILDDLYQLYKAVMLKSLGHRNVFGYNSFLLERRYYEREEVVIETDEDWEEWVDDILYEIEVEGEVIEENDPTTFYLRRPEADETIDDALRLADEAKERGIQDAGRDLGIENSSDSSKNFFQKVVERIFDGLGISSIFAMSDREKLDEYLQEEGIDPEELTPEELYEILEKLGIDPEEDLDEPFDPREIEVKTPSDYLTCGMEIPVGEVFELTWDHLVELLDTVDEYIEESNILLDQQAHMNSLSEPCDCPCEGDSLEECGECVLTCDLEAIREAHEEVSETRERMRELAEHIELLTDGHFNTPTEDVCDPLNEDIRSEEEESICEGGGEELITKHELITRKLNYSRFEFDECITRPEHLEEALEGRRMGKMPFFGPLVEEKDLPRYTKTEKDGARINTSEFNWFCCSDSREED